MSNNSIRIGCAGAGIPRSAIIQRLVYCGFQVDVWNRDRRKIAPLLERGAVSAESPSELAMGRDVVLTRATNRKEVEVIIFDANGVAAFGSPDKLLIDLSMSGADSSGRHAGSLVPVSMPPARW